MTRSLLGIIFVLLIFVSTVSAQEKIKLPISASSKTLGYSPVWVAWRQGFFDRQGLDVQVVFVEGAVKRGSDWLFYYGGADKFVGVATAAPGP